MDVVGQMQVLFFLHMCRSMMLLVYVARIVSHQTRERRYDSEEKMS